MSDARKQRLMALGLEPVVDALLSLIPQSEQAEDLVDRMLASPEERVQRYKKGLASLKRSKRFIRRGESHYYAQKLEALLQELKEGVSDPEVGAKMVVAFYQSDNGLMGNCDDSDGSVGDVFRYSAQQLFVHYASACDDKAKVRKLVEKLNLEDPYGLRDALVDCAEEYLPEAEIRKMVQAFQKLAASKEERHEKSHSFIRVESLAKQLGDGALFEQTRRESWEKLSDAAYVDIARVYFKGGEVETALSWIEKFSSEGKFYSQDRDSLLADIYQQQGNVQALGELLRDKFNQHPTVHGLEDLLKVIGEQHREAVVDEEVARVIDKARLNLGDAQFLIGLGRIEEASEFIIRRSKQLNGEDYYTLPELFKVFEESGRFLAASVILRSLLSSLLERAYTRAYGHGVRYLKKLEKFAPEISDWKGMQEHAMFAEEIRAKHGRKSSFWKKYQG